MPPDEKIEEEVLTDESPFDMNSFVEDLVAKEALEDDVAKDEDGPPVDETEGELPEDDDGTDEDEEEDEQEEEEEKVETEDEPKAEATVDLRDAQIDALRIRLQDQNQQLIDILAQQVAQKEQAPTGPTISDTVLKLALFGGDEEAWKALSPVERAEGTKHASDYMAQVTRHVKDPKALYTDLLQTQVQQEIRQFIAPLLRDTQAQRGQDIIDRYAKDLVGEHRQRLLEVYNELPGSRSRDWGDLEASFKAAAQLVRNEVSKQDLESRERKVETSKRQKSANKEASRSKGRRGSRRPPKNKNRGGWDPSKSLADYAQALQDKE